MMNVKENLETNDKLIVSNRGYINGVSYQWLANLLVEDIQVKNAQVCLIHTNGTELCFPQPVVEAVLTNIASATLPAMLPRANSLIGMHTITFDINNTLGVNNIRIWLNVMDSNLLLNEIEVMSFDVAKKNMVINIKTDDIAHIPSGEQSIEFLYLIDQTNAIINEQRPLLVVRELDQAMTAVLTVTGFDELQDTFRPMDFEMQEGLTKTIQLQGGVTSPTGLTNIQNLQFSKGSSTIDAANVMFTVTDVSMPPVTFTLSFTLPMAMLATLPEGAGQGALSFEQVQTGTTPERHNLLNVKFADFSAVTFMNFMANAGSILETGTYSDFAMIAGGYHLNIGINDQTNLIKDNTILSITLARTGATTVTLDKTRLTNVQVLVNPSLHIEFDLEIMAADIQGLMSGTGDITLAATPNQRQITNTSQTLKQLRQLSKPLINLPLVSDTFPDQDSTRPVRDPSTLNGSFNMVGNLMNAPSAMNTISSVEIWIVLDTVTPSMPNFNTGRLNPNNVMFTLDTTNNRITISITTATQIWTTISNMTPVTMGRHEAVIDLYYRINLTNVASTDADIHSLISINTSFPV